VAKHSFLKGYECQLLCLASKCIQVERNVLVEYAWIINKNSLHVRRTTFLLADDLLKKHMSYSFSPLLYICAGIYLIVSYSNSTTRK